MNYITRAELNEFKQEMRDGFARLEEIMMRHWRTYNEDMMAVNSTYLPKSYKKKIQRRLDQIDKRVTRLEKSA